MAYLRFIEKVNRILAPLGMVALLIMMTAVTLNVLGRAIFNTPIFGTIEVVSLTGVIMLSFIAAYTQLRKQNIIVTIVVDRMPQRLHGVFNSLTSLLSLVFVAVMVWTSGVFGLRFPRETTDVFEILTLPFRLTFLFGSTVLFLVLAGQFVESLAKMVKN